MLGSKLVVQSLAALVLAGSAVAALAADGGWYAGVGVGSAKYKDMSSAAAELDALLLAEFGITATSTVDDSDTAWKLFAGYRFNKNFALEGSYADLGNAGLSYTAPGGTASGSWEGKAWSFAALGILPVTEQFEVFGKVGVHHWNVDLSLTATDGVDPFAISWDDNGTNWLYGLGASYSLTKNIAVRADWVRYQDVGDVDEIGKSDVDMWTLGIQYQF